MATDADRGYGLWNWMTRTRGRSLAMELDVGASAFTLYAFCCNDREVSPGNKEMDLERRTAWVCAITGETGGYTLVAGLFGGCCSGCCSGAFAAGGSGGGRGLFGSMALVDMS